MYLQHLAESAVSQNCVIPEIGSEFVCGLTSCRIYSLRSCHKFSIGLKSGDSGGSLFLHLQENTKLS